MSRESIASSGSTFDEETECVFNHAADASRAEEEPHRQTALEWMTQKQTSQNYAQTEAMTMGCAVRVPYALQAATRRTMLDVLTQVRRQRAGESVACRETTAVDKQEGRGAPQPDLSRSLRHLMPAHRSHMRDDELRRENYYAEEVSISDFDGDDSNNDGGGGCSQGHPRHITKGRESTDDCLNQHDAWIYPATDENTKKNPANQRTWNKLFDCDSPQQGEFSVSEEKAMKTRKSTKSSHMAASSLQDLWNQEKGGNNDLVGIDDDVLRQGSTTTTTTTTAGAHTSLATLLNEAEARYDEVYAQSATGAGFLSKGDSNKNNKRISSFTDVLDKENTEENLLLSSHCLGKPVFNPNMPSNGSSAYMSAAFTLLQGVTKQYGGVRGRQSAALKQLSDNPTSARIIAFLTRSFKDWKLEAAVINRVNEEGETHDLSSCGLGLLESSGVQLKLLVKMVESAFSLYYIRCEIVWVDAKVREELYAGKKYNVSGLNTKMMVKEEKKDVQNEENNGEETSVPWTVVLTTPTFHSTPIIVGSHLYLAQPFFSFPDIQTIVASLNITSDVAVQKSKSTICRQRRQRDADGLDGRTKSSVEAGECIADEISLGTTTATATTTTPSRANRPSLSLSGASPFRAYDPFVNPSRTLFCKTTNPCDSSLQGNMRRSTSLPRRTTAVNMEDGDERRQSLVPRPHVVTSSDSVGGHFPRGPGNEWDVPLEVLLALCPPRRRINTGEANIHCSSSKEGGSITPRRICSKEHSALSSFSSLSSVDNEESSLALTEQAAVKYRYDKVILSD